MWDFLTKKCGIFGIEGGTKLWDFQHQGGAFRPLTSGHTDCSPASAVRFREKSFFDVKKVTRSK